MKTTVFKFAGGSLLALLLAGAAVAVPITGSLEIFGQTNLDSTTLGTATSAGATTGIVVAADGDFVVDLGAVASYGALVWNPVTVPVNALWSVAGPVSGSFDLLTLVVQSQDSDHLDLAGTGILHLAGFDDTLGLWSYSITDSDGIGSGPANLQFGFLSSNSAVGSVPEGGTTAILLGMSLVGLCVITRRLKLA